MKKYWLIKVQDITNPWNNNYDTEGYYTGLYNSNNKEEGQFIGYTNTKLDSQSVGYIQIFKTLKAAENKLLKLNDVKSRNGYLCNMNFQIVELTEESDLIQSILKQKEARKKQAVEKNIIYTGVGINYLKEYLELEQDKLANMSKYLSIHSRGKQEGRVEILKEIINDIEGRN